MRYALKKCAALAATLLIMSFLTFLAFQVIPGDSAMKSLGDSATPEQVEALREEMGLNKSLPARYGIWLKGALRGDFGESAGFSMPVKELIRDKMKVTAALAGLSLCLILVFSVPLGLTGIGRRSGRKGGFFSLLNQFVMAIPPFFLGMLITLVFGLLLKWFVPGRFPGMNSSFLNIVSWMIFPAVAVAVPKIAMMVKFMRSSVFSQMNLNYVRTARSKGMTERRVLYAHVLKNAMIPVITFLAMIIADIFAGSIVVEQVFNLPGMGRLLVVSIANRDFNVVQAIVLYIASLVLVTNVIVDVLYHKLDPRLKLEQ
ncbi:ABC transporter permease [Anaerolentibacter hominis]|uniref:ABC transporter permease n=1 Tax=Anaerolentibacter hominis TaxID=3079009 RepID=UPI0031B84C24